MLTWIHSTRPGPTVCISTGIHGNERAPVVAMQRLASALSADGIAAGSLLLVLGNPEAWAQDRRYSRDGVDLNRCFTAEILGQSPGHYEERRAGVLAEAVAAVDVLVDFHCTVEPGGRFAMHHPDDVQHRDVAALLDAPVVLRDPKLLFGGCSFDEHVSTRGGVGICYETGWIGDPTCEPGRILDEMRSVLCGLGVLDGVPSRRADQRRLVLTGVLRCSPSGFAWADGVGENLQALPAGAMLGVCGDGSTLTLPDAATLVFPKKRPELLQPGAPLVYLAAGA
ncbi:MAG: putative deacylase [Myxococcota bacterium]|jgi:predicted deacylase